MDEAQIIAMMMADLGNEHRDRISAPDADAKGRPLASDPDRDANNKAHAESDRAARQAMGGSIAAWNRMHVAGNEASELPDIAGGQGHRSQIHGISGTTSLYGNGARVATMGGSRNTTGTSYALETSAAPKTRTRAPSPRLSRTIRRAKSGTTIKPSYRPNGLTGGDFTIRKAQEFMNLLPKKDTNEPKCLTGASTGRQTPKTTRKAPILEVSDDQRRMDEFMSAIRDNTMTAPQFLSQDIAAIERIKLMARHTVFSGPIARSESTWYAAHPSEIVVLNWLRTFVVRNAIRVIKLGSTSTSYATMFNKFKDDEAFYRFWHAAGRAVDAPTGVETFLDGIDEDLLEEAYKQYTPPASTATAKFTDQAEDNKSDGPELSEKTPSVASSYNDANFGTIKVETTVEQTEETAAPGSVAPQVTTTISSTAPGAFNPFPGQAFFQLLTRDQQVLETSELMALKEPFSFGIAIQATTANAETALRGTATNPGVLIPAVEEILAHLHADAANQAAVQSQAAARSQAPAPAPASNGTDSDEEL